MVWITENRCHLAAYCILLPLLSRKKYVDSIKAATFIFILSIQTEML